MRKSLHRITASVLSLVLVATSFPILVNATEAGESAGEDELSYELSDDEYYDLSDDHEDQAYEESDSDQYPDTDEYEITEEYEPEDESEITDQDDISDDVDVSDSFNGYEDEFYDAGAEEEQAVEGERHGMGYIYVPGEGNVESIAVSNDGSDDSFMDNLPREYVTPDLPPLRNQGIFGTCWAHSAMAVAEINARKTGLSLSPDYSELHLAYFSYEKNSPDPLGGTIGDVNRAVYDDNEYINFLYRGGNHEYASNVLASWTGAADETTAPYYDAISVTSEGIDDAYAYDDVAHLKNYYKVRTDNDADRNAIKSIIRDCGAAEISFYALRPDESISFNGGVTLNHNSVYSKANNCYYFPHAILGVNHSVTIVGWKDDFPAQNFVSTPEGDGAWLIRNSWTSGDTSQKAFDGYFWLSYYDKSIAGVSAWGYEYDDTVYDNNYQYDGSMTNTGGYVGYFGQVRSANVFEAKGSSEGEVLKAVSICPVYNTNVHYEIDVYKNLTDASDPTSGTHVSSANGNTTYAGYYTVPLDNEVELKNGDTFSVVVMFEKYENGENKAISVARESSVNMPNAFVRTTAHSEAGQSFLSTDGGSWEDIGASGNGNIRIKAFTCNKTGNSHTVTFDANGGSFGEDGTTKTKDVSEGDRYGHLPIPERTGYSFKGWFSEEEEGTEVTYLDYVDQSSAFELYAHWLPNTYRVSLDANGGVLSQKNIKVTYDSEYGELPSPVKDGYEFVGWFTDEGEQIKGTDTVSLAEDHKLYAHWKLAEYKVTFDPRGGTIKAGDPSEITVTYNSMYGNLPEVTREGYKFEGWYTKETSGSRVYASTSVTEISDHTLYAQWTANKYRVSFDGNKGTSPMGNYTVTFGGTYGKLPDSSREGYTRDGWWTEREGGTEIKSDTPVTIPRNHTLYAHWTANEYTVSFDAGDGTCETSEMTVTFDEKYGALPTPQAPEGKTFIKWIDGKGNEVTAASIVKTADEHTLHAVYAIATCTVTFDVNGGDQLSETLRTKTVSLGGQYGTLPVPIRDNYDFNGWWTEKSGGSEVNSTTEVITALDHTLYAHWTEKVIKIKVYFDAGDGTCATPYIEVTPGESYGNLPVVQAPEGYTFSGWFTQNDSEVTANTLVAADNEHTLYAKYTINKFKVTLDANGGSYADESITKEVYKEWNSAISDEELDSFEKPSRGRYSFTGWYSDADGTQAYQPGTPIKADTYIYAGWKEIKNEPEPEFSVKGIDPEGYVYTGSPIFPKITVYDNSVSSSVPLEEKVDYTLTYQNNTKVSNDAPAIVIKGKGRYSESMTVHFAIVPASIGNGDAFADGFTVSVQDKKYNGENQWSLPTIKYGKVTLRPAVDFVVMPIGDNLKGPGTVTLKVNAIGSDFTGSAKVSYSIYTADTDIGSLYFDKIGNISYTGEDIDPDTIPVTVRTQRNSEQTLIRGTEDGEDGDYFVRFTSGSNRKNVGTAKLEIVGKGRYTGRKTLNVKIDPMDIGACSIAVSDTVYDGNAQKPAVTVSYMRGENQIVLNEGKDYTLSYSRNTNAAGKDEADNIAPTVTIRGKGNFSGSVTGHFTIGRCPVRADELTLSVPDIKTDGKPIEARDVRHSIKYYNPVLKKTANLTKGRDYEIKEFSYADGKQLQKVTFSLKGNYVNDGEIGAEFLVYHDQITGDGSFEAYPSVSEFEYTGSAIKPQITVKHVIDGQMKELVEGRDYKVAYSNNTKVPKNDDEKNAPSWKITGCGAFKGTLASGTFRIKKRTLLKTDFIIEASEVKFARNKEAKPKVKVIEKSTGKALASSDYDVSYSGNKEITEKATVTVTGKGNYDGQISETFRIYGADIGSAVFDKIGDETYTGRKISPKITAYRDRNGKNSGNEDAKLIENKDYRLEYGENIKTGTGTVTVIGIGSWGGKKTLNFKIKAKKMY